MRRWIKLLIIILLFAALGVVAAVGYMNTDNSENANNVDGGGGFSSTTGAIFSSDDDSDDYRQAGQQNYIYDNYIYSYLIDCSITSGALYLRVYNFDDNEKLSLDEKIDYSNLLLEVEFKESGVYEDVVDLPLGCYWFVIEEENENVTARAKLTFSEHRED